MTCRIDRSCLGNIKKPKITPAQWESWSLSPQWNPRQRSWAESPSFLNILQNSTPHHHLSGAQWLIYFQCTFGLVTKEQFVLSLAAHVLIKSCWQMFSPWLHWSRIDPVKLHVPDPSAMFLCFLVPIYVLLPLLKFCSLALNMFLYILQWVMEVFILACAFGERRVRISTRVTYHNSNYLPRC